MAVKPDPVEKYRSAQIQTANQGKLILMMYDGAIKFINIAVENFDHKCYDVVNANIIKAQDIILELMLSVDTSVGEIGEKLYNLYNYMYRQLLEGNVEKDEKKVRGVLGFLKEIRESWAKVAHKVTSKDREVGVRRGLNLEG